MISYGPDVTERANRGLGLSKKLMFAIFAIPFGSLFQQMSFEWIEDGSKMYHGQFLETIREDEFLYIAPFIVLLFWPLQKYFNKLSNNKFLRLLVGLILMGLSFYVASVMESWMENENKQVPSVVKGKKAVPIHPPMSIIWQSPQYILYALGEFLFVSSGFEILFGQITTLHAQYWFYWLASSVITTIFIAPIFYYMGHYMTTIAIASLAVPALIYANSRY
jgi:hypothetical protein